MNIRDEVVLRELNLYPVWVRRDMPVAEESASPVQDVPVSAGTLASVHGDAGAGDATAGVASLSTHSASEQVTGYEVAPAAAQTRAVATFPEAGPLDWPALKMQVKGCAACKLRAGCTQTVFGVGDEKADWLFVGEGPGADEDAQGEPFVGQAGKLLDNMLAAIKLKRGNKVYIANVVKCRPPNNRTPEADEIATCLPYLQQQIAHIKPKLIVALGKTAATALLGREATLGSLRGTLHEYRGTPLIVTYHPAYLLRSPAEKAKAWQDLCFAVQRMADSIRT